MKAIGFFVSASVFACSIAPALADDAMASMAMMKKGEVIAIMPDGHMGTSMMSDDKMMGSMMKMSKPMSHCMMFMTGADGKTHMIDTSSKMAMKSCEKMAM